MARISIFFLLFTMNLFSQVSGDQLAFQRAMSASNDSIKLAEIDKFILEYKNSTAIANAYAVKFQAYSNLKNDSAAFWSLRKYLSLIDRSQVVPALNDIAFEFAQRKYYLDSAAIFIDSAIVLYNREEPVLFNTKALVLFRQQRFAEAMKVQQKALSLLPENASVDGRYVSFFVQMGFIQLESAQPLEGLQKIILSNLVLPKQSLPAGILDSMLTAKTKSSSSVAIVRDSLYTVAIAEYLKLSADSVIAKSNIAVGLSRNRILPERAWMYAGESYRAAQTRTIEERSGAAAAYGLTGFHLGRYDDAERYLMEAAKYAPPTEVELFVTLGEVKEHLGKKSEAFDAYVTVVMGTRAATVRQKLIELKNELFPTSNLDSIIVARQAGLLKFTPEEYNRAKRELPKNKYERVVLAELFTGSECKPCMAADIAFDYLIERYRTSSLAILEYHLHIPLPDPLSNPDAEQRSEYYSVNSTPSAIFNGKTVITSGGSRIMAKNKFFLYSDIIDKEAAVPSSVSISLSASIIKDNITVRVSALSDTKNKNLKLSIALVEDEVMYKGANGIEHHKFVVRKMITSGMEVSFAKKGKVVVNKSVNLNTVIAELEEYYAKTNDRFVQLGSGLKEKKTAIDRKKLALVAFIQDDVTREILQAVTEKVSD